MATEYHAIEVRQLNTKGRTLRTFKFQTRDVEGKLEAIRRAFNMDHTLVIVDGVTVS